MELANHSLRPYPNEVWKYDGTLQDAHKMLAWVYEREGFGSVGRDAYTQREIPDEVVIYNKDGGKCIRMRPGHFLILDIDKEFIAATAKGFEKYYEPHTKNKDADTEVATTD